VGIARLLSKAVAILPRSHPHCHPLRAVWFSRCFSKARSDFQGCQSHLDGLACVLDQVIAIDTLDRIDLGGLVSSRGERAVKLRLGPSDMSGQSEGSACRMYNLRSGAWDHGVCQHQHGKVEKLAE